MAIPSLTTNAIRTMIEDDSKTTDPLFRPVLQIMNIKKLQGNPGAADRYRVILSDGIHFMQGMLASQLTSLVQNHQLVTNCCVILRQYMRNLVANTTIVIALEMEVLTGDVGKIGSPVSYTDTTAASKTAILTTTPAPLYNTTNAASVAVNNNATMDKKPAYGARPSPARSNPYGRSHSQNNSVTAAPIIRNNAAVPSAYTAIQDLNMYLNRSTIRARVASKSDVRTWSNAKSEGRLFSVEFLDESCDIRATFFKEAVDKFYNYLEVGQVYTVTGGRLKVANVQYNTCKSNYEMTLDQNAEIHLDQSLEAKQSIASNLYDFTKIAAVEAVPEKQSVDILGVVTFVGEPTTLLSKKSGREMTKCDVTLVDDSDAQITLTLWGQAATEVAQQLRPNDSLLAIRRARVSDYNGKSLSGSQSHQVIPLNPHGAPNLDAALQQAVLPIVQWWQSKGATATPKALSTQRVSGGSRPALAERKPLSTIRQDHLGQSGAGADWISFKAEISFLKKDKEGGAWYPACPNAQEPCQNRYKVAPTTDGQYHCEKCGQYYPNCVRRWIFSALLEDESSSGWVSFFNEQAETLLDGVTADQVYEETVNNPEAYDAFFSQALHSEWIFRCKVKQDIVDGEPRTKTSVVGLFPVDYVSDANAMLAALQVS